MKFTVPAVSVCVLVAGIASWISWGIGYRRGEEDAKGAAVHRVPALPETRPRSAAGTAGAANGAGAAASAAEAATGSDGKLPPASSPLFAAKVREVFADPFENRRLARLQLLLEQCNGDQFAAMVPLIHENDLRGTGSSEEWELVMQNWARKDGAGVMEFIRTYDWKGWHPLSGPGAKYEALVGWATANPKAALAHFSDPANNMQNDSNLQRALVMGWVAKDPEAAALWALAPEQASLTRQAHQLIVDAICRKGGQELLDKWFNSLPKDSPGLAAVARAVNTAKNRFQPGKAAEWIESQKGEPWIQEGNLVTNTATSMASRDPAAALAWAGRTGSPGAVSAAMQTWCSRDIRAASEWLKANPQAAHYDHAAVMMVRFITAEDPEGARAWANTIKDAALREQTLNTVKGKQ